MESVVSTSERETEAAGAALAQRLEPGTVVALYGELGAGKTRFVRGIVAGLGGDPDQVSSPTFAIVQEYATPAVQVVHVDAYRVRSNREFAEMGFDDVLYGDAVVLVEWPERLEPLPRGTLAVRIIHAGGNTRRITMTG